MSATNETFRVELLRNIPHLHLDKGDILMCSNSGWDAEKVRVLRRESDGWDPECNLYRCDVKKLPLAGRSKILDGFCCQGGASMGYHQVGFVPYGIDINPQPHYPFPFHQGDVIQVLATLNAGGAIDFTHKDGTDEWLTLDQFVAAHMSPPCQAKTKAQKIMSREHPRLIAPTRELLIESGLPYVIENVVPENEAEDEDPLIDPIELCGAMFGLGTYRHRLFESNMPITAPDHPAHIVRTTKMGRPPVDGEFMHVVGNFSGVAQAKKAMGISWMTRDGLRESIPPAYTEHIGRQLMAQLVGVAA